MIDVIIIGLGGMGSATAYQLARRGQRVLGLDAYERGHTNGSSHGRSRIIREAYFESPEYVPLVQRAYTLWRELESESGRSLLRLTGGLGLGRPAGELIGGMLASARQHSLPYEELSPADVRARFPGLRPTDDLAAVFEPNAGILDPEACVAAHLDLAASHGAVLKHGEPVRHWAADSNGVRVETDQGRYRAERLVITPGPWAGELLADLGLPLIVQRVVVVHFEPSRPELFAPERCPVYIWELPEGVYYGFPTLPDQGLKFGRHDPSLRSGQVLGGPCTPSTVRRQVDPEEIEALRTVLDRYLPGASGDVKWTVTCLYTLTPDQHFVLDHHPEHRQVVYACGFSGHGFKFASVIGEVLADLALDGATRHPVGFLAAARLRQGKREGISGS